MSTTGLPSSCTLALHQQGRDSPEAKEPTREDAAAGPPARTTNPRVAGPATKNSSGSCPIRFVRRRIRGPHSQPVRYRAQLDPGEGQRPGQRVGRVGFIAHVPGAVAVDHQIRPGKRFHRGRINRPGNQEIWCWHAAATRDSAETSFLASAKHPGTAVGPGAGTLSGASAWVVGMTDPTSAPAGFRIFAL